MTKERLYAKVEKYFMSYCVISVRGTTLMLKLQKSLDSNSVTDFLISAFPF